MVAYMLLAPAVIVLVALAVYPLVFSGVLSFKVDPLYNPEGENNRFVDLGAGTPDGSLLPTPADALSLTS